MDSVKINTISTVDAVRSALEQDILKMHFAPGEKITEIDLSVRYGVSRNTVREAIAHLLAQGLLTKIANKGIYVQRFTVEDVLEIFHLRELLELEAAQTITASNIDVSHLYKCVDQLEQINRQIQWGEYVQADIAFHRGLVAAANSPRLSRLYETIITEVKLCIFQTRNYVSVSTGNTASHRLILDAICSKDTTTAKKMLKEHIDHVIKRYCAGLIAMNQQQ